MIEHRPYGIDDPYNRLPIERTPRDPEPGPAGRVGFLAASAASAWASIEGPGGSRRATAQPLGGLWTAAPAPLERIPVFARADSERLELLLDAARGFAGLDKA